MGAQGIVVQPGKNAVPLSASFSLKLRGEDTGSSIMVFEETITGWKKSTFHVHQLQRRGSLCLERRGHLQDWRRGHSRRSRQLRLHAAACRMPGRAPVPKPGACSFFIRRRGPLD